MQIVRWARQGNSLTAISTQLDQSASDSDVRILLLDDRGTVLHDTENNQFTGRGFPMPPQNGRRPNVSQGPVSTPSGIVWSPTTVASMILNSSFAVSKPSRNAFRE